MMDDSYLYNSEYFKSHYLNDPKRDAMYRQEYERIYDAAPLAGNILDIGCGVGNFLSIFDKRWVCYGYEPSAYAAEKAEKRGIEMVDSLYDIQPEFMDVVVFRGTIQHINYPMSDIEQATRVLKPGGLLVFLATPNADGIVYKLFGNLPALDPSRNWIVFGEKMLVNILIRLNYEKIKVIHPYSDTPYAYPLRDCFNFAKSLLFGYRPFAWPKNMMEIYAVKK
jgi:SAM-dependent methyltransferase